MGQLEAEGLAPGDAVRVRIGLHCRLTRHDGLVLELPDRRVTFPDAAGAALGALLGGGTHVVGELPDMPETDQVVLVRRLLREGVVVPAARP